MPLVFSPANTTPIVYPSGTLTGSVPVHIMPEYVAEQYVTVRLSNGSDYYSAGGTTVSGGSTVSADQGSPNTLGNGWPVKLTDGAQIYGARTTPFHVLIASGGLGAGISTVGSAGAMRVDVVQTVGSALPSGSVTGLLIGGLNVANSNPVPISDAGGSLTVDGTVAVTDGGGSITVDGTVAVSAATVISGSVVGPLVGGLPLSNANPFPISDAGGSLTVDGTVTIQDGGGIITVDGTVAVTDGGGSLTVDGTVVVSAATTVSGSVTGLLVGGLNVANSNPIPISDAGGAITVDGTVTVQDGGGSLTVDGTVTATQGTAAGLGAPWPIIMVSGSDVVGTSTHPLHTTGSYTLMIGGAPISAANPVPISDGAGALTVDGTVNIGNIPSVTAISGSVYGLLVGGQPAASANPLPTYTYDGTGQLFQAGVTRSVSYAFINATASGNTAVVAAQGIDVKIRVLSVHVMSATALSVRFESAAVAKTATYPLAANGGFVLPYNPQGWCQTAADEALNINLSGAGTVGVTITWIPVV